MIISVRLVVISNWVLIALSCIGAIVVFDPFGGFHTDKSLNDKLWEKRLPFLYPRRTKLNNENNIIIISLYHCLLDEQYLKNITPIV